MEIVVKRRELNRHWASLECEGFLFIWNLPNFSTDLEAEPPHSDLLTQSWSLILQKKGRIDINLEGFALNICLRLYIPFLIS
jgi:hypothetical protein